ncbi:MAG: methyltransferase domain-containing protein [Bdellovibrionales bacterium]|nr:methyltransferase domain-containing protein [Bdellovibrionales bacterium]
MTVAIPELRKRFGRAAGSYQLAANLQAEIAEWLLCLLPDDLRPDAAILDVGCGTGVLTRLVRERFPRARMTAIDCSEEMIRAAARQSGNVQEIRWIVGDMRDHVFDEQFDLIVSSSALHWMEPLKSLFQSLAKATRPGGLLVASMMTERTLLELHRLRRELFPENVPARRLPSVAVALGAIETSGFALERHESVLMEQRYSSAHELLKKLNKLGVTGGSISSGGRPLSRAQLKILSNEYERRHSIANGVVASYEALYFVARRQDFVARRQGD